MSASVRPEPSKQPANGLPPLHRILSPDEFEQAQTLSPAGLRQANFPVIPAPYTHQALAPNESTYQLDVPRIGKDSKPLTGLPRILMQYVAQPIADHPIVSALTTLVPGAGYVMAGLMGKDLVEYGAQKAAETQLDPATRKLAEADPTRIPGEQAAVEAVMLGAAPLVHGALKVARGAGVPRVGSLPTSADPLLKSAEPVKVEPLPTSQVAAVRKHMAEVRDAWRSVVSPASRSPEATQAAHIIRATTGEMAAKYEQAAFKLDEFRRAIEPLSGADKLGFIDAIEGGASQPRPEFQAAANTIRQTLDETRDAIRALGTGKLEHFIDDYFPHIWADPEKAAELLAAARSQTQPAIEGSKAFLKAREIPTTAEGIALGLQPVSMNPVDLTMLKLREMQRYLMAHESLNEMRDMGLVQYVKAGELAPDGYAEINDKIATAFGPREGAVTIPEGAVTAVSYEGNGGIVSAEPLRPEEIAVQGMRIMGKYWAPEPVTRVVNNYLTPGLRGNAIYDAYRGLGNTLNQAQLGLSAFHLGFTSMDATVSRTALGLEYLASGKPLEGLREIASAPAAPVTNALFGRKIRAAYLNPEGASPEMRALANAVKEAGGRVRMDSFYNNSAPSRMIAAWKEGSYGKAAALSIPAVLEAAAKPLMEHIVPMQKLGVFGDLAKKVLADLPPEATLAERRAALASAWDSVDNRMGQVVYDNLFWSKTFKDLAMASVRSVGWNLGTIRELGGGIGDIATAAVKTASGKRAVMTHRASYVVALPITVGMYGALYQYLRTGQGPQELRDYFYPKTGEVDADGNAERVQLPSYMKDVVAYAGHPWDTVKHKMSPILSTVYEMLQNQDFYGDQIRNPMDPTVQQLEQEASYVAKQTIPFSIRNLQESGKRGDQSAATKFGTWFGVTPAPRRQVRSDAQNTMADYLSERQMSGATPEDAAARQSRAEILSGLRGGTGVDLSQAVTDAIERHQLTPDAVVKMLKRAGSTPAQEKFKRLTIPQAIDVFQRSTPREKALFAEALLAKIERLSSIGSN